MSDLIAIVYPTEEIAEQVRQRLIKLQQEYLITINDAVIAVKNDKGAVKLNQLINTTAVGAASGSFWGLLIGLLFLNPILGVALGAASGALGGVLSDRHQRPLHEGFVNEASAGQCGLVRPRQAHDGRQGAEGNQGPWRRGAEDLARRDKGEGVAGRSRAGGCHRNSGAAGARGRSAKGILSGYLVVRIVSTQTREAGSARIATAEVA
jgi:Protein of unknown function (DUF1269)